MTTHAFDTRHDWPVKEVGDWILSSCGVEGVTFSGGEPFQHVGSWPGVVKDCLDRIGRGEPPPASVCDGARAVSLTFDAYRAAGETPAKPAR